jgi:hypothetical protein
MEPRLDVVDLELTDALNVDYDKAAGALSRKVKHGRSHFTISRRRRSLVIRTLTRSLAARSTGRGDGIPIATLAG